HVPRMVSPPRRVRRRRTRPRAAHQHAGRPRPLSSRREKALAMDEKIPGHDLKPIKVEGSKLRMYKRNDPEMPEDFRRFMVKLLKYAHVENCGNPHYRTIVANIADAGLRYAPDGRAMMIEAEIVKQEVGHGQFVADIIRSLGEDPYNPDWVGQY